MKTRGEPRPPERGSPQPARRAWNPDGVHPHFPPPGNCRAYLQQPGDATIVAARPDLKTIVYPALAATQEHPRTGLGFVLLDGSRPVSFDFDRVEQRFEAGCLPLLTQCVLQGGFRFTLDSFTRSVGDGRGLIHFRMTIWRSAAAPEAVELGWLATEDVCSRFASHPNMDYVPFEPWAPAWESRIPLQCEKGCLRLGDMLVCAYRHSGGVRVQAGGAEDIVQLRLRVAPGRSAPETVELVVPYPPPARDEPGDAGASDASRRRTFGVSERATLLAEPFESLWKAQAGRWASTLARATAIDVPDPAVQSIYRTLTLNNVQFLGGSATTSTLRPGQGGFNSFATVYAWEASHYLPVMARQGYREEVRRVLDYLLTTQTGHAGPEGDIVDADGSFRPHIHWMNETGAVLGIFAEYALASRDFDRLKADADALLRAARWIQRQRASTRKPLPDGSRPPHEGLLPRGRPHDWPIRGCFFFSDAYTWRGLDLLAAAFHAAGLREADWLRKETDDYRNCILTALRENIKPHPLDPTLAWIPNEIGEDPATAIRTTIFCGPHALLGSGILDAGDDMIPRIEASLRAAGCLGESFAFRMRQMEDETLRRRQVDAAGGDVELFYVTFAEASWHRVWIERGEFEKAEALFKATLACSVSRDLHLAHERYCPQLPWLLPWQPNASANGRILEMVLRCLCFVKGDTCHLLQGVPSIWFDFGVPLGVDRLCVGGSLLTFSVAPVETGRARWRLSYSCQGAWIPRRFVIALPGRTPGDRAMREFLTGGKANGHGTLGE